MRVLIDANFSYSACAWIAAVSDVDVQTLRDAKPSGVEDEVIVEAWRKPGSVLLTKDRDFVDVVIRLGPPPAVIWLTCGNAKNRS